MKGTTVTFQTSRTSRIPGLGMCNWPLGNTLFIVPIPGSCKIERLEENIGAVHVNLTEGDLREIDSAISNITVLGDRY
jgi:aryl-alcohol dehydrogenase-like predicted oxidoreductase